MFPAGTAMGLGGFTVVEPGIFGNGEARFRQSYIYPRSVR
jgi:hypothetical protein